MMKIRHNLRDTGMPCLNIYPDRIKDLGKDKMKGTFTYISLQS